MAEYNLGIKYMFGTGVDRGLAEPKRWLELSAQQGYVSAQYKLAWIYSNGESSGDFDKATHWFRLAAEQGEPIALYALGDTPVNRGLPSWERVAVSNTPS
jgi:uncharacterized protein